MFNTTVAPLNSQDSLPGWSKGVDSKSTSASCVGANPFALLSADNASLAQLVEHALRKRMVVGSIPTGGFVAVAFFLLDYMARCRALAFAPSPPNRDGAL